MENQINDEREQIDQKVNQENLQFEAYQKFNNFLDAINDDKKLASECKNIHALLDHVVFNDEKDQFVKQLNKGTKLYRARIIDNSDFGDSNAGFEYNEEEKSVDIML